MYFEKIVASVQDAFKDRERHSWMERTAGWLRLARLGNEDIAALRKQVASIAAEQAKLLVPPKDLHELLGISMHYMAWGELFGEDFLPIIRPIFMECFEELCMEDIGLPFPDHHRQKYRSDVLAKMFAVSGYAMADISSLLPIWREKAFARIDECKHSDEDTAADALEEKAEIDQLIAGYKPLPGSEPFSPKEDITA